MLKGIWRAEFHLGRWVIWESNWFAVKQVLGPPLFKNPARPVREVPDF